MTTATNYTTNKFLVDNLLRAQTTTIPTTLYWGLFVANAGYWVASTAYTTTQYILPQTPNGHIYKCTTAGTTSTNPATVAAQTTAGGTVTDGTAVFTEQTLAILAGTLPTEATYTGYARVSLAAALANWNSTQGNTSASTATGLTLSTSNVAAVTFGAPTSTQTGVVAGMFLNDSSTSGGSNNYLFWSMLTNPKTVNNGDAAPNFPAAAFTITWS